MTTVRGMCQCLSKLAARRRWTKHSRPNTPAAQQRSCSTDLGNNLLLCAPGSTKMSAVQKARKQGRRQQERSRNAAGMLADAGTDRVTFMGLSIRRLRHRFRRALATAFLASVCPTMLRSRLSTTSRGVMSPRGSPCQTPSTARANACNIRTYTCNTQEKYSHSMPTRAMSALTRSMH